MRRYAEKRQTLKQARERFSHPQVAILALLMLVIVLLLLNLLRDDPAASTPPTAYVPVAADLPTEGLPQPQTVRIAFQCYERGAMIWHSDSGTIYVLVGFGGGAVMIYQGGAYAELPTAVGQPPRDDLALPMSGFGKVWRGYGSVRDALGWVSTPEVGYDSLITPYATRITMSVPDGVLVDVSYRGFYMLMPRASALCGV
jgi:hypothetical protein